MSCSPYNSAFCVELYTNHSIDSQIPQGYIAVYSCDNQSPQNLCTTNGCRTENLPLDNETSINLKVCCCSTDMCNLNMPNPTTDKPNPTTTKLSPATQFGTLLNLIISVAAYLIYQILQK
ncbi:hypothetical protein WR25_04706 [Diploscapter pachys]|uniref:Activin types I and II receptor domain-containing protein n=1 Tax=Diploscapter pachys TaxID=2018661 RepID=A0A2A2KYD5_9BILA|nr:hypothetical protein WR25_04706 [Diploscapter pachys]